MDWHKGTLIGFDVETTGLDLSKDEIISSGIVVVSGGDKEVTHSVIKPSIPVPDQAINLHKLSRDTIEKGKDPKTGIEEMLTKLAFEMNRGGTLVVFNAPFDLTILDRQAIELGLNRLQDRVEAMTVIDPLVIDRAANPTRLGRRNLQTLCRHYRVKFETAHHADGDAISAARLAWKMADTHKVLREASPDHIHWQQAIWAASQASQLALKIKKPVDSDWPIRKSVIENARLKEPVG